MIPTYLLRPISMAGQHVHHPRRPLPPPGLVVPVLLAGIDVRHPVEPAEGGEPLRIILLHRFVQFGLNRNGLGIRKVS